MRTITHRELRNNSSSVLREVSGGETFQVTNRGEVVATIAPAGRNAPDLQCARPAKNRHSFSVPRHAIDEATADALDDLRSDR